MKKYYSQYSNTKARKLKGAATRERDPIWLLMENPLFAARINTLIVQSREKWISLEQDKLRKNPFYRPVQCPVTLDAITWISAFLKYYFLQQDNANTSFDYIDDLGSVFNVLLNKYPKTVRRVASTQTVTEDEAY